MDNRFIVNQPLQPTRKTNKNSGKTTPNKSNKTSFRKVLADKLKEKSGVEFSKHAQQRILSRNIEITEKSLKQLQQGVKKLDDKGAKDSLVMVDQVAYVVSVENKTVVTAIDNENVKENVFTNIDSAVFM